MQGPGGPIDDDFLGMNENRERVVANGLRQVERGPGTVEVLRQLPSRVGQQGVLLDRRQGDQGDQGAHGSP